MSSPRGYGAVLFDGSLSITDGLISENVALVGGGGLAAAEDTSTSVLDIYNTLVTENDADLAGGAYFEGGALGCIGATAGDSSGFWQNTDSSGAAGIYLYGSSTFRATLCDLGSGTTENGEVDIYLGESDYRYWYGDDQTFSCDFDLCGTETSFTLGSDSYSVAANNYLRGNIFLASDDATIETIETRLQPSSSSCTLYYYLLSASSTTASTWTIEYSGSLSAGSTSKTWYSSAEIGFPVTIGRAYATVTAWSCSSSGTVTYYYDTSGSSTGDADFGTTAGFMLGDWSSSDWSGSTLDASSFAYVSSSYANRYYQRITWSH